jgi:hypothetical protein
MSVIDPRSAPDASAGFDFVGVIDPLLNDNLDALAAAASTAWMSTSRERVLARQSGAAREAARIGRAAVGRAGRPLRDRDRRDGAELAGEWRSRMCPAPRHAADIVRPGPTGMSESWAAPP